MNFVKYIVAFVVVIGALGYFIATSMSGDKIYYKEVSELLADPASAEAKGLRVSGDVTHENFTMNKLSRFAKFEVTDAAGGIMNVVYNGTIPDAFEMGASVILEGTYDSGNNLFTANKLMAKCPSKYEAEGSEHPEDVEKQPNSTAEVAGK